MARQKKYIEEEVIEKAMLLFWRNGYECTSVRMLEKEMGINQFSMYASFGNKEGVFLESIKFYKKKAGLILIEKLNKAPKKLSSIEQYFRDFLEFSRDINNENNGCLLTNTINELGDNTDSKIKEEILIFVNRVKASFIEVLKHNSNQSEKTIMQKANYLMIALQGLSIASKMFNKEELDDFITRTFVNM